ncbi:MAG: von Willebrand factor type A domain-containing protein [Thermoguttaceae bacterium]|jgi:Ca-activated chloride channel family protein|nr:von Willebrand factor type A domain-containing protein [Thermoguttaceae bacterium]
MSFNADDPKYTAYVLNELSEQQRAEVREEIRQNPEVRKLVKEIHAIAGQLQHALRDEPAPKLDSARRKAILDQSRQPPAAGSRRFSRWVLVSVSMAVALHLVVATVLWHRSAREPDWVFGCPDLWEQETDVQVPPAEDDADYVVALNEDVDMDASQMSIDVALDSTLGYVPTPSGPSAPPTALLSEFRVGATRSSDMLSQLGGAEGGVYGARSSTVRRATADSQIQPHGESPDSPAQPFLSPSLDDFPELRDNKFLRVADHPLSTFSIDVDTASYAVVRQFLGQGRIPPKDAVRVEELINYFPYDLDPPEGSIPFAAHLDMTSAPWNPDHRLVRIALKGRTVAHEVRPPLNLVFLIDVSGSMSPPNRLPLVVRSMQALAKQLDARDHVAIVVYAGSSGLVLPPTRGDNTQVILDALDRLRAGGSTAGGAGIQLAYQTAQEHFDPEAMNRVILCTDGDFNVGITQRGDLERLIEEKAKSRVFLTVLGFGMGNYKDSTLELLSNKGNGNYAYIDDFNEARKVLVDQMLGTLVTIAKDVKIQVEFNPAHVAGYRLVGYENRMLRKEDFHDDRVDAGDIGAGHTVTAFYELIPAGRPVSDAPAVDELRYQAAKPDPAAAHSAELLTVKLRYKEPDGDVSSRLDFPLGADAAAPLDETPPDFRFAAAVAAFGQLLRENEHVRGFTYDDVLALATPAVGEDPFGYRAEFLRLVRNACAAAHR